jgi:hypothetical protein
MQILKIQGSKEEMKSQLDAIDYNHYTDFFFKDGTSYLQCEDYYIDGDDTCILTSRESFAIRNPDHEMLTDPSLMDCPDFEDYPAMDEISYIIIHPIAGN